MHARDDKPVYASRIRGILQRLQWRESSCLYCKSRASYGRCNFHSFDDDWGTLSEKQLESQVKQLIEAHSLRDTYETVQIVAPTPKKTRKLELNQAPLGKQRKKPCNVVPHVEETEKPQMKETSLMQKYRQGKVCSDQYLWQRVHGAFKQDPGRKYTQADRTAYEEDLPRRATMLF